MRSLEELAHEVTNVEVQRYGPDEHLVIEFPGGLISLACNTVENEMIKGCSYCVQQDSMYPYGEEIARKEYQMAKLLISLGAIKVNQNREEFQND